MSIGQGCLTEKGDGAGRAPWVDYAVTKRTNSWKATREKGKVKITGKTMVDLYYNLRKDWWAYQEANIGIVPLDCNNSAELIWEKTIKPMIQCFEK